MSNQEQQRWREISTYLDEALDLEEAAREAWLKALDDRAPAHSAAVRVLLAERERLQEQPLLSGDSNAAFLSTSLAGQQLGAYTLESVLGAGGMGTVWLAHRSDGRFEGHVAVKLLNSALLGRPAEQRFLREGMLLAKFRHRNIAQLLDAGVAPGGQPYLVLEYVEGQRIDRYAQTHGPEIEARLRLFLDVLAAVAHAHARLIVHRDLKPSNILVTADGTVKLLDFGIAALLGPNESELTRESGPGLTPEYAAPEQLLGQPITTATDVYALGLVLFVLLAGQHPLRPEGKSGAELARATLEHEPPHPSQIAANPHLGRTLRGDLDNIVAKALRKDPAGRYSSAEAFAEDVRRFLTHQPVSARADSLGYRASKFVRRNRGTVAAGALIALVLIAATAVTTLEMFEARRQRDAAIYQSHRAEYQARFAYQIMSELGGDGQPITISQLMAKGIEVLEKNHGDDPRFVIDMLVNISGRYMDVGDTNGEYAALVKAEALARKLGDPDEIAYVQCNTVETELAAGRPQQAVERMQDGLANLAKITHPSLDRQIECGMAQARLLWSQGKLDAAVNADTRVAQLMEANGQTGNVRYQSVTSMLEVMYGDAGRSREALAWNRRGIASLERAGREGTLSMSGSRHNQAAEIYDMGNVQAAYDLERPVVDGILAQQGLENVPPHFLQKLGLYQVRLQETDAGLDWINKAVSSAVAQNNQPAHLGALLNRARAQIILGRADRASADLEAAEQLARANPETSANALRSARLVRTQLLSLQGDPSAALRELDGLLGEIGYPQKRVADRLGLMLTLKARTELALARNTEALASAHDAVAVTEAIADGPDRSADLGAALFALAQAQRATGDGEGARTSAQRATVAFTGSLGPNHSETRAAAQFQCCERQ